MHPHGAFSRLDGRRTAAKTPGAEAPGVLVREAGLEPARPEWTLEPESKKAVALSCNMFRIFHYTRIFAEL